MQLMNRVPSALIEDTCIFASGGMFFNLLDLRQTTVYVKRNAHTLLCFCLWVCVGNILVHFLPNVPHFHSAVQDGTLQCGHQSATHIVGVMEHTCVAFSKACCTFVTFSLTYTIEVQSLPILFLRFLASVALKSFHKPL